MLNSIESAIADIKKGKLIFTDQEVSETKFFRDFDLNNRAKIMNDFFPHASLIIHYNVDEKNNPWKQTTKKNYTMAFIGGAFTRDNLTNYENKIHSLHFIDFFNFNKDISYRYKS